MHFPGLKVVNPSTPYDAKGLMLASIRDPNPVCFVEHKVLYKTKGEVPEGDYTIPLGVAEVKRPGRDITVVANNIMVMKTGHTDIKIADFGAAFLRKSKTAQSTAMGSPFYMAPEQIEGKEASFHSDMYSLGVVLYELLTGKRPFLAESLENLVKKILHEAPAPPSSLRKGLPKDIDMMMLRLLGKRPEHRYPT